MYICVTQKLREAVKDRPDVCVLYVCMYMCVTQQLQEAVDHGPNVSQRAYNKVSVELSL